MDMTTFYKHARRWKKTQEERDREAESKRQKMREDAWSPATAIIRAAVPVEGIQIFEGHPDMTGSFPEKDHSYSFCVALPGAITDVLRYDDVLEKPGIIIACLTCARTAPYEFAPVSFSAGGACYENVYDAFLAACEQLGYRPEVEI